MTQVDRHRAELLSCFVAMMNLRSVETAPRRCPNVPAVVALHLNPGFSGTGNLSNLSIMDAARRLQFRNMCSAS